MSDVVMSAGENTYTHVPPEVVPGKNGGTLRPVRTSEAGAALVRVRWERKSAAVRRGLAAAGLQIPDVAKPDAYAVVTAIATNHALNAMDPSARGSAASARLMLDHGWPSPERSSTTTSDVPPGGLSFTLSAELARELLDAMRARAGGQGSE